MKKIAKLELKKQTIVDLSEQEAQSIAGGTDTIALTSVLTSLSDLACTDYTHTGWSCGGCSTFGGDTENCTACDCGTTGGTYNCVDDTSVYCIG